MHLPSGRLKETRRRFAPLDEWLPDEVLQAIAQENNLAETAFFVPKASHYELRWFTPLTEVDLCGKAIGFSSRGERSRIWRGLSKSHSHPLSGERGSPRGFSQPSAPKVTPYQDLRSLPFFVMAVAAHWCINA